MASGTLLLWLLLVPGADTNGAGSPEGITPLPTRDIWVPIAVDPPQRGNIRELELYASSDQGRSWDQVGRELPSSSGFKYIAPADGEYWFQIRIVYKDGKMDPEHPYKGAPGPKVRVHTTRPVIQMFADRNGDQIAVRWDIRSDIPDPASLKLEYRTADTSWTPVLVSRP